MIDLVRRGRNRVIPTQFTIAETGDTIAVSEVLMGSPEVPHARTVRIAHFIRWWLKRKTADYSLHMHKVYNQILESLGQTHMPAYSSFRNVMYILKRLRLVSVLSIRESADKTSWDRVYYTLVPGNERHKGWEDPVQTYRDMLSTRPGLIPPTGAPACAPGQAPTPQPPAPAVRPAPKAKAPPTRKKRAI